MLINVSKFYLKLFDVGEYFLKWSKTDFWL